MWTELEHHALATRDREEWSHAGTTFQVIRSGPVPSRDIPWVSFSEQPRHSEVLYHFPQDAPHLDEHARHLHSYLEQCASSSFEQTLLKVSRYVQKHIFINRSPQAKETFLKEWHTEHRDQANAWLGGNLPIIGLDEWVAAGTGSCKQLSLSMLHLLERQKGLFVPSDVELWWWRDYVPTPGGRGGHAWIIAILGEECWIADPTWDILFLLSTPQGVRTFSQLYGLQTAHRVVAALQQCGRACLK